MLRAFVTWPLGQAPLTDCSPGNGAWVEWSGSGPASTSTVFFLGGAHWPRASLPTDTCRSPKRTLALPLKNFGCPSRLPIRSSATSRGMPPHLWFPSTNVYFLLPHHSLKRSAAEIFDHDVRIRILQDTTNSSDISFRAWHTWNHPPTCREGRHLTASAGREVHHPPRLLPCIPSARAGSLIPAPAFSPISAATCSPSPPAARPPQPLPCPPWASATRSPRPYSFSPLLLFPRIHIHTMSPAAHRAQAPLYSYTLRVTVCRPRPPADPCVHPAIRAHHSPRQRRSGKRHTIANYNTCLFSLYKCKIIIAKKRNVFCKKQFDSRKA